MTTSFAPYGLAAAVALLVFRQRFQGDRRRLGNGVLLGACTLLLLLGALVELDRYPHPVARAVTGAVVIAVPLSAVAVAGFLLVAGVRTVRREGPRPANLLSLAAGVAVLGVLGLTAAVAVAEDGPFRAAATAVLLVAGYLSFLLACFVGYAVLYHRAVSRRTVDFVVVLGAGLTDGSTVPPLLAARLDRALTLFRRQESRGRAPVLLVSGGKGSDERVPEAEAMADYLTARGVPDELLVQERSSTNTRENLEFSGELMERIRPGYRCVVVTNDFHALRAAITARRAGVRGEAVGAPTAAYYRPGAALREFAAVLATYPATNLAVCAVLAAAGLRARWSG
ncbi:YdcF family protein [Kitasatospora sp. NPDC056327]|uniref:YdcF family protein n=1 Tax=Kitasatospora sp. NPDC056327 TaxID=3345785 RepID=UPI0035E21914